MQDILLVKFDRIENESHIKYSYSDIPPLTDHMHNYDVVTDTVSCPITLEDIPVDECVVATCW